MTPRQSQMKPIANDVDSYIAAAPREARAQLVQLRKIIRAAAPKAEEGISYGMPYYKYHGALVGFAAFKKHISLFGAVSEEDKQRLQGYETTKGTVRFPIGKPLPVALIRKLIKARAKRHEARTHNSS